MGEHGKARAFEDGTAASIGELVAISVLCAPCCGHIALCDDACRDGLPRKPHPRKPGIRMRGDAPAVGDGR